MTGADARPHTPSISEVQAAIAAARNGAFATGHVARSLPTPARLAEQVPDPGVSQNLDDPAGIMCAATSAATPVIGHRPPIPGPSAGDGVWLLGTHGGSGARCLASVLPGTRHCGRQWPTPAAGRGQVVLVCRTSQRGLSSAQDYARHFRDAELRQHLDLLGVIVSADAPGRVPPPLRRLEKLLSGATPILGAVPWQPAWRLGPPRPPLDAEAWLTRLQNALATAVPR